MDGVLIRARGLTKRFGDTVSVRGIDLDVFAGEAFGLLGSNGAGKSSTMRMLGCVSRPSGGELHILGLDPMQQGARIRARLGACPQFDNLDLELTVVENLTTYARYFGISRRCARSRAVELLELMGLSDRADSRVQSLSGGMKRRLTIARALVNDPDIVLFDEPTTGLDPQARHLVWERLSALKRRGATLVLTTHYMDEAEQLCDRVAIMDRGVIVAEGSPRALIKEHSSAEVVELRFAEEPAEQTIGQLRGIGKHIELLPDRVLLYSDDGDGVAAQIQMKGLSSSSLKVRRSTLEDVFLQLTGRTLID